MCVLDFGLARPVEGAQKLTVTGVVVGSPAYMPPEQARGVEVDGRADVYALGATLYEVLTGRAPFAARNLYELLRKVEDELPRWPRSWDPTIDPDLETIVLKCLEKDPARRYATAEALADDLTRYLESEAIDARPASMGYRLRKRLSKRKALVAAGMAGLVGIAASLGILVPKWRRTAVERDTRQRILDAEARARPHLDRGREVLRDMERLLSLEKVDRAQLRMLGERARAEFARAVGGHPASGEGHLEIARAWRLEGEEDRALESCSRAVEADPLLAAARLERAKVLLESYEELRHDNRTGRSRPQGPGAEALWTRIEADLAVAERTEGNLKERQLARALRAFAEGRFEEAGEELERYAREHPADAEAWAHAGHAWFHVEGKGEEALAALTKAFELRRGNVSHRLMRGLCCFKMKRYEEAEAEYTRAIDLDPKFAMAYSNRGNAREGRGDLEGAIADHTKAIDLHPKYAAAYTNRGNAKSGRGDLDGAIADYSKALVLDPKNASAYYNRGLANGHIGDLDGAISDFTKAIDLDSQDAMAYNNRGGAKYRKGNLDGAIADYSKALELDPKDATAYYNRGLAKGQKGNLEGAVEDFIRAIELASLARLTVSKLAERLFAVSLQLLQAKNYPPAILAFRKLAEVVPTSQRGWGSAYNLACAYALTGERGQALDWLEKAVEMGWRDVEHLKKDADLDSLRTEPRYARLLERLQRQ